MPWRSDACRGVYSQWEIDNPNPEQIMPKRRKKAQQPCLGSRMLNFMSDGRI